MIDEIIVGKQVIITNDNIAKHAGYLKGSIWAISIAHTEDRPRYLKVDIRDTKADDTFWLQDSEVEYINIECTCGEVVCANCRKYRRN